jgi:hypothetical protein
MNKKKTKLINFPDKMFIIAYLSMQTFSISLNCILGDCQCDQNNIIYFIDMVFNGFENFAGTIRSLLDIFVNECFFALFVSTLTFY